MIIDCHCHAGMGDGMTGPWDTSARLARYLERAARAGIERSVLFPAFHSNFAVANASVARIAAERPDRFYTFAFVNAGKDAGRVGALVARAMRDGPCCGIKVHRALSDLTREVCDTARALRLPILYDVLGEVAPIELFATEYPDVPFIVAHLGSFAGDWRAHLACIDQLVRHPNVFADTAGVQRFDYLVQAVKRAGPGKLLFGSDGPWLHPGVELCKIRELRLPPQAEQLVLGGNWLRLTAPVRGPARLTGGPESRSRAPCAPWRGAPPVPAW